jgi:hypothetical protein
MTFGNDRPVEQTCVIAGGEFHLARHVHERTTPLLKPSDRDSASVADKARFRSEHAMLQSAPPSRSATGRRPARPTASRFRFHNKRS